MFRLICLWGAILLLLSGCSSDTTPTRHNDFTPLTSIEIVAAPSIAALTSTRLKVNGNYSGQFTWDDITAQAVWSSDTPTVATVITAGSQTRVTSHLPGTAILTATVGSVSATFTLTVTAATISTMTINPVAPSVPLNHAQQFAASGTFSDGTTQDLTFDASWTSSDTAVATVSNVVGSKGLAHAVAVGSATISATVNNVSGSTPMTVTVPVLQSITVSPVNPLLSPVNPTILSQSVNSFKAMGHYSDGSAADITAKAAWTSSQPGIAAITTGSRVKTLVPGSTLISAGLLGVSGTSNLKVTGGNLTGIVLSPANPTLSRDTGTLMTATGSFSNNSTRDITGAIDWSVVNPAIATVTIPGANLAELKALAVTAAPIAITAKSGGLQAVANLTVVAPPLLSLDPIPPPSLELYVGTSIRLTLSTNFSDGTKQNVTANAVWSSGSAAATVGNGILDGGRVSGVAASAGPVTISAKYGGLTVTVPVTVTEHVATALTISGPMIVHVGNQANFTATATYNLSQRDVTADVIWSNDKPNIAGMVDNPNQPGLLVGVDSGTATLTAVFSVIKQIRTVTIQ